MPLEIRPCIKEDAQESVQLMVACYEDSRFRKIAFPNGISKESIDKFVESRVKAVEDPDKYPIKVVDTDTGEMVACALWAYTKAKEDWDREKREALEAHPEARRVVLEEAISKAQDIKQRILGDSRWWELVSLSTLPKYQRRGIGSMVMEWGVNKLEEMQVPGFVESTDKGLGLYIKYGFKELERWKVDLGQWPQWGGSGIYYNAYLVRQPTPKTT